VNSSGSTSNPDRNGVRWYQIRNIATGQTPAFAQFATAYQSGSANKSYWMGTVMVSGQGHAAMGFNQGGPNNYLDAATTERLVEDALGTLTPSALRLIAHPTGRHCISGAITPTPA
jgi:hypothetical protein